MGLGLMALAEAFVSELDACPRCKASWVGAEIAEEHRHLYGGRTHGSLLIGIYDRGVDRTVEWVCPACQGQFDRNAKVAI